MKKRVCHISYNHDAFDDRIYWKELITLTEAGYEAIHICVGEANRDFITTEGVRIIQVKSEFNSKSIWLQRFKYFLFRKNETIDRILFKAKGLKADIYHYHDLQINAIVKSLKILPWKPFIIYDSHEAYHLLLLEGRKTNLFKKLFVKIISNWEINCVKNCHYIITTDNYTKEYFTNKNLSIPCSTIYNYSSFINNSENKGEKEFTFIYTGLMNRDRGLFEMAEMILKLNDSFPDIKLLLVGSFEDNEIEKTFKKFIISHNLKDNIHIHKQVDFKEIKDYYNKSKIGFGLFHQTPKYKTFIPIKLFEYMAFGLPVIFSNHGPSSKIIEKENCGQLVDERNPVSIINAAQLLLTNYSFFSQQSENGRMAVINEYSWQKEKEKLISIYYQLLNG